MSQTSPVRYFYGPDPSQFADLHVPAGPRRPGTVVLIHGGFWRAEYGASHLGGVAADLARRGWVTCNIEYRRLGVGGGYPSTLEDAAAAVDYLTTLAAVAAGQVFAGGAAGPVVAVGHSAGGHLATWVAGRTKLPAGGPAVHIAGVVSLAGVLGLAAASREKLGNGAATDLMGGSPDECPERYAVADPLAQVPILAVVRCVHARADDQVPFAQSVTYVAAARAAGQDAQLLEVSGDHYSVADASSPAWPTVIAALEELTRKKTGPMEHRAGYNRPYVP